MIPGYDFGRMLLRREVRPGRSEKGGLGGAEKAVGKIQEKILAKGRCGVKKSCC